MPTKKRGATYDESTDVSDVDWARLKEMAGLPVDAPLPYWIGMSVEKYARGESFVLLSSRKPGRTTALKLMLAYDQWVEDRG